MNLQLVTRRPRCKIFRIRTRIRSPREIFERGTDTLFFYHLARSFLSHARVRPGVSLRGEISRIIIRRRRFNNRAIYKIVHRYADQCTSSPAGYWAEIFARKRRPFRREVSPGKCESIKCRKQQRRQEFCELYNIELGEARWLVTSNNMRISDSETFFNNVEIHLSPLPPLPPFSRSLSKTNSYLTDDFIIHQSSLAVNVYEVFARISPELKSTEE